MLLAGQLASWLVGRLASRRADGKQIFARQADR